MLKIIGLAAAGLLLAALLALAAIYLWKNHGPDRKDLAADIARKVARWQGSDSPADVVVAIVRDGEGRVLSHGPGRADGTTLFQIGSISKVFTTLLLQRLVDDGRLSMNATLAELIGERYPLAPSVAGITLRQLATHTSGLPTVPQYLEDEVIRRVGAENIMTDPYNHMTREEVLVYLANPVGGEKPGSFAYSNYGMGLLAHVMELVTGKDYPELLREQIFDPVGMRDSHGDLREDVARRLIQGHDAAGNPAPPWRFSSLAGAGSITSNAEDLIRFISAEFDPASPLADSLARQRERQPKAPVALGWFTPAPHDWIEGNSGILWHNGAVNGYFAYLAIDPERRIGVAVLANRQKDVTALGSTIMRLARTQSW
ncbi:serine hydrolase domain-containing protein [Gellertiella hungarica]|uniref:CubicO group peptidase (Beta-lactamase class C family) n=1 Tax=Gellertiella hungarica TaxID=1572859 RepID=A0A7W6NM09_9HYPH|nr:serine hydrolase domain-containing protein [Gellertiella hungarica]MBB4065995.1 CubicO group peptidase (beta-lactamase class C family) [Gellertiella hungarica]